MSRREMMSALPHCPICYEVIREPVVFPCSHEICRECFGKSLETANLWCPLCRKRVSSWARKNVRNPVDVRRRKEIQERLSGSEKENLAPDSPTDHSSRILSDPGEINKEYVSELNLVRKEREEEVRLGEVEAWRLFRDEQRKAEVEIEREEQLGYLAAKALHDEEAMREKNQLEQFDEDEKMAELLSQDFILQCLEDRQRQTLKDKKFAENVQKTGERFSVGYKDNAKEHSNASKKIPLKPPRKRAKHYSSKTKCCVGSSEKPITFWLKPQHLDEL